MTRETILILLGILIALSPWSGLPISWLGYGLVIVGAAVAIIGWTLRERGLPQAPEPVHEAPPVETPAPVIEELPPAPVDEEPPAPPVPPRRRPSVDMPSRASRIAKF